jgi:hypothetical protein
LNPNEGLVGTRVAAVATGGKFVEGDNEFSAVLYSDRFFKLPYPWIDDGPRTRSRFWTTAAPGIA